MNDLLDEDGYPTDYAVDKIAEWCYTDHIGLMQFIKPLWHFADFGGAFYVARTSILFLLWK